MTFPLRSQQLTSRPFVVAASQASAATPCSTAAAAAAELAASAPPRRDASLDATLSGMTYGLLRKVLALAGVVGL